MGTSVGAKEMDVGGRGDPCVCTSMDLDRSGRGLERVARGIKLWWRDCCRRWVGVGVDVSRCVGVVASQGHTVSGPPLVSHGQTSLSPPERSEQLKTERFNWANAYWKRILRWYSFLFVYDYFKSLGNLIQYILINKSMNELINYFY